MKPVATKERVINAESAEYLHRASCGPSSSPISSPSSQTSHQFRGSDFGDRVMRSTMGPGPVLNANDRSLEFDRNTSRRESVDQETLAPMVREAT